MYIPKQGDICYANFSPTIGHEQSGKRPFVIISRYSFNKFTGMAIVCPITSNMKIFPTHYKLLNTKKIKGMVLCEHVRSIDYEARDISFIEKIDEIELEEILDILNGSIEL